MASAHLVFVTKHRRGVPTAEHLTYLRDLFTKICQDFDAFLVECNGEDDPVHPLAGYPPTVSITALVNSPRGALPRLSRLPRRGCYHPPIRQDQGGPEAEITMVDLWLT